LLSAKHVILTVAGVSALPRSGSYQKLPETCSLRRRLLLLTARWAKRKSNRYVKVTMPTARPTGCRLLPI